MSNLKNKFHKNLRSFIENNRHVIELILDVLHFYIFPPLIVYCGYYSYWWWNASLVDHSTFVDVQFSLRGNTVSIDKIMEHKKNFYWICEVDWPNRLADLYQLDKDYRVFRRHSRYIYKYERPDLICKKEGISTGKTLPVKFRNFFYRSYCQNVHHYIITKEITSPIKKARVLKLENNSINIENNNKLKNLKICNIIKNIEKKNYGSFFLFDNYNDYISLLENWKYKQSLSKMIGKYFNKNIMNKSSNIFFKNDTKFKLYNLKKFKFDAFDESHFSWIGSRNNFKPYNYSRLKYLKICSNGENFFSPFDFEVKYLEYKKNKENHFYVTNKKNIFFRKIKNLINNNKVHWKQFYLNDLNFKSKKKLLLESRLKNRLYQEKLIYWSFGRRVPYKFKHDNLLNDKMFKSRSHYYNIYADINKKRRSSTNSLSIANWANNYKTNLKDIYWADWYKNGRSGQQLREVTIYRRHWKWRKYYVVRGWWNNNLAFLHPRARNYFIMHHKTRRRYIKCLQSVCNNRISYKRVLQREILNMRENLFNITFTEEHFKKSKSYAINNKNAYLLDVSYKKERILKTELNNYKKISLTKKNKKFMTTFPLRQNCNVNFLYVSKKPYDSPKLG